MNKDTAVYRHFSANGTLLYVGISCDPEVRARQHAANAEWWPLVDKTDVAWYKSRVRALAEERKAVLHESPMFNIRMNEHNNKNVAGYTVGEYADIWQVSRGTVYTWFRNGWLECAKIGRICRIMKEHDEAFRKRCLDGPLAEA